MDKNAKKLSLIIFLSPILMVILSIITIYISMVFILNDHLELRHQQIQQNFFNNLKQTAKNRVNIAYNILNTVYNEKCKNKNISEKQCKKEVFKELIPILDDLKWPNKGYVFVLGFYGNTLYHPNHKFMKINRWNSQRNGIKWYQLLVNSAKAKPKGTYVEYLAYNFNKQPIPKVSYVKVFKPFKCLVGSGVYLNDLNKKLIELQKQENSISHKLNNTLKTVGFIVFFISLVISTIIAKLVQNMFLKYESEIQKEKEKLKQKALIDNLTGLFNRNYLDYTFDSLKNRVSRNNEKLAILFIDLDSFKEINDTLGHKYGDILLKEISKKLKSVLRKEDVLIRFGGDEFIVFIPFKKIDSVITVVNKIFDEIKKDVILKNKVFNISVSIGISVYPDDSEKLEDLIKYADMTMYKVKKTGKGYFKFYKQEVGNEITEKINLTKDLIKAIKDEAFEVYFQPKIFRDGSLYGSEALIRWNHPTKGFLTPDKFLPIAYEKNLIKDIDFIVLKKAVLQYKKWEERGLNPGKISCNITTIDIKNSDFFNKIKEFLEKINFNPNNLILEVTEENIMENPKENIKYLNAFRKLGIGISIDDFGTGYSSLSYFLKLPITELKIDRMFIVNLEKNKENREITKFIISLGKSLNLNIVAEGVENEFQKDLIIQQGADIIQGYLYSPPIKAEEFEEKFLKVKKDKK